MAARASPWRKYNAQTPPPSAKPSLMVSEDEERQSHIRNIKDLGRRAEQCWKAYQESEIMKVRCDLIHWQSRQKALQAEVDYAAEVVSRKTHVLNSLEKQSYSEAQRRSHPVPIYGRRASVYPSKLATLHQMPSRSRSCSDFTTSFAADSTANTEGCKVHT